MALFENDDIERYELYNLFAGLFMKEPTAEELIEMKEMLPLTFEETVEEVGGDFRFLFGLPHPAVPPYESFYRYSIGDRPGFRGRAAEEVATFYRSVGLVIHEEFDLIPDHISAELIFMSYLVWHDMEEPQRRFLDEHLLLWVPDFCDRLEATAGTVFYREVAKLLREYILSEDESPA